MADTATTPGTSSSPVRTEYLLGALTAIGPLTIDLYLPALPTIAKDLGVAPAAVELTLASYFAGFALGQLLIGPILDRLGRLRPLRFGLALYLLGTLICMLAPSLEVLVGARFIQALGGAVVIVVPRAIVRDLYRGADIARAMTRLILVMGVAPIVAPLLGGLILPLGWRPIFGLLLVAGVLVMLLSRRLRETHRPPAQRRSFWREAGTLVTERDFVAYSLVGGFAMGAMFAYISASSNLLIGHFGVDSAHFGFYFGANALSFIAMSQASRWMLRHFSPRTILRGAMVVLLGGAGLVLAATLGELGGLALLMLGLTIYLGALGVLAPNATALALEPHGARAGLASALMGASQSALAALFAFTVSSTNDGTPGPLGIIMASGVGVAALLLLTHTLLPARPVSPPEEQPAEG